MHGTRQGIISLTFFIAAHYNKKNCQERQPHRCAIKATSITHSAGLMLIQCHSCNTKYRLNLERIPRRKTFVRCKNCGTPIFIDPTEEAESAPGVIPPAEAAPPHAVETSAVQPDAELVVCPNCQSRYRVAPASLQRPGIQLKCTQCGHQFAPPEHMRAPAAVGAPEFYPPPAGEPAMERPQTSAREMRLPDDAQMETLFDDLRPDQAELGRSVIPSRTDGSLPQDVELGVLPGATFDEEPLAPDADRAYLDAVGFDDDAGTTPLPPGGSVSDEQKYRYFLNPQSLGGGKNKMSADDDIRTGGTSPGERAAADAPDVAAGGDDELPPLDPVAADLPPVPAEQQARPHIDIPSERDEVAGQPPPPLSETRILALLAAASLAILIGAGLWGYWLATSSAGDSPYILQLGQPHQLALEDDLKGRYVNNRPSGQRLFVVSGEVENRFPGADDVRWIRIKGVAYADAAQTNPVGSAFAYAGNLLEESQLTQWELAAIKAYYGFNNGRKDLNFNIPSGAKVPYQLVFANVSDPVGRTVAEIVSYHRGGQAVFIDSP